MQKTFSIKIGAAALAAASLVLTACSDEESITPPVPSGSGSKYVIAATVDDATRLVTTGQLASGTLSKGTGLETDAGAYWIFKDKKALYRLVYNKGAAGTGSSYRLDASGNLVEDLTFEVQRFSTYGIWGNDIVTSSTGNTATADAAGNIAQGLLMNYLNASDGSIRTATFPAENFLGNGEKVCFSGFVEAGGRLYTSVIPMGMSKYGVANFPDKVTDPELVAAADGGTASGAYEAGEIPSTQFPDSAFVAIYTGSDFDGGHVIARTGKIGFAAGRMRSQYYQTIWAADNGDVYVFSPGFGRLSASTADLKKVQGELPSGVVRIKAGETDFAPDYYVNLETVGNNHPLYRCWHISDDYFLCQFYTQGLTSRGEHTLELGIFKGEEGTLRVVTGLPDVESITSFGENPYGEDGVMYVPVVTSDGRQPALYKIDAATATATRGIEIEAETVSAVGLLRSAD